METQTSQRQPNLLEKSTATPSGKKNNVASSREQKLKGQVGRPIAKGKRLP